MSNQAQSEHGHYNIFVAKCPSRKLLNDVTRRWSILVLATLLDGPQRFSQIREHIDGISDRMLSFTLELLVNDGLINKDIAAEPVVYALTTPGTTIATQSAALFSSLYHSLDQLATDNNH